MSKKYPWKVDPLTAENAGAGLTKGCCCTFQIPDYWDFGNGHPQNRCELLQLTVLPVEWFYRRADSQ